jgi:3-oxoacyl-[acyl-carrier-protein] synthase II
LRAEIAGYGSSTDGDHMTRPQPAGAARAIAQALSSLHPEQVDWVKAHGTGTRHNDAAEAQAIHAVFGRRAAALPVTSMKSLLGHSLGASGVVEAVGVVLALAGGFVPPTRNCERPDPSLGLDIVAGAARPLAAGCVLANAFGFGGNNAALVLKAA